MEDHTTESIGQHHGHLATVDVIGPEHFGGAVTDFLSRSINVPVAQIIRTIAASVTAGNAGAMFAIGCEHTQATGLMQPDVTCKCSIAGCNKHFLPVASEAAPTDVKMLTALLQAMCSLKKTLRDGDEIRCAVQPRVFGGAVVTKRPKTIK
ncbi:MAG: Uncharacterised protein [Synechococcus sp. MIT S9220]|nr:MAG: Uncharacterised protein [Synechococcus sp. MIT S9220]